jgi:hypothetical protein
VNDLLISIDKIDTARVSELWSWLVPPTYRLIAMSCFGDSFFEAPGGAVHMVDTLDGKLRPVASSKGEFVGRAEETSFADQVLLAEWVRLLRERGVALAEGQCYGWKVMPLIGAPMNFENIGVFDAMTYQVITSTFLEKLTKLPPGAKVSKFLIDGKEP